MKKEYISYGIAASLGLAGLILVCSGQQKVLGFSLLTIGLSALALVSSSRHKK